MLANWFHDSNKNYVFDYEFIPEKGNLKETVRIDSKNSSPASENKEPKQTLWNRLNQISGTKRVLNPYPNTSPMFGSPQMTSTPRTTKVFQTIEEKEYQLDAGNRADSNTPDPLSGQRTQTGNTSEALTQEMLRQFTAAITTLAGSRTSVAPPSSPLKVENRSIFGKPTQSSRLAR